LIHQTTFYDEVTGLAGEGRAVGIDRAFDPVSHNILVEKPLMCGLDEQTVRWIEN